MQAHPEASLDPPCHLGARQTRVGGPHEGLDLLGQLERPRRPGRSSISPVMAASSKARAMT
jgi:hypothetical protein